MAGLSLRDAARRLDPIAFAEVAAMRDVASRVRWEDGWQGNGPLSTRLLWRTFETDSLRAVAAQVGAAGPGASVRNCFRMLGYPLGGGASRIPPRDISLRDVALRMATEPIRLLSYNTYLLVAVEIPLRKWIDRTLSWRALDVFGIPLTISLLASFGLAAPLGAFVITTILEAAGITPTDVIEKVMGIRIPPIRIKAKPALDERAFALGSVARGYDLCCLSEVFKPATAGLITEGAGQGWTTVAGPSDEGEFQILGSGLEFMSRRAVVRTERMVYENRGDRMRDTDAWSNKGVLFNGIDIGVGELEVFQTHFYFGGGMPIEVGAVREPTPSERMEVWRHELDELMRFVRTHHRPENVAIVTGDFNMDGANARHFAEVRQRIDQNNLHDPWAWDVFNHRPSEGQTSRFTDNDDSLQREFGVVCDPQGTGPDDAPMSSRQHSTGPSAVGVGTYCIDDTGPYQTPQRDGVGRYDYLWVERPSPRHRYRLELSRVVRRPFPLSQTIESERYLSDHLCLDVNLFATAK